MNCNPSIPKPWLLCGLFALLLTMGCDDRRSPFEKKYRPPQLTVKPEERIHISKPTITFIYSPINKRDPFRPPWEIGTSTANPNAPQAGARPVAPQRPKTELEKFELDQLKVVAIITGIANPLAMVEDPSGRGFYVRRGTLIGRNSGRVARIQTDGVVISEVYRDVTGKRIVNRVTLRIKEEQKAGATGSLIMNGRRVFIGDDGHVQQRSLRDENRAAAGKIESKTNRLFRRRSVGAP